MLALIETACPPGLLGCLSGLCRKPINGFNHVTHYPAHLLPSTDNGLVGLRIGLAVSRLSCSSCAVAFNLVDSGIDSSSATESNTRSNLLLMVAGIMSRSFRVY